MERYTFKSSIILDGSGSQVHKTFTDLLKLREFREMLSSENIFSEHSEDVKGTLFQFLGSNSQFGIAHLNGALYGGLTFPFCGVVAVSEPIPMQCSRSISKYIYILCRSISKLKGLHLEGNMNIENSSIVEKQSSKSVNPINERRACLH